MINNQGWVDVCRLILYTFKNFKVSNPNPLKVTDAFVARDLYFKINFMTSFNYEIPQKIYIFLLKYFEFCYRDSCNSFLWRIIIDFNDLVEMFNTQSVWLNHRRLHNTEKFQLRKICNLSFFTQVCVSSCPSSTFTPAPNRQF